MKNEEVDRIFQIASESFRTKWEIQQNSGKSLIELKVARKIALAREKQYQRKCTFWLRIILVCIPLFLFIQFHFGSPNDNKGAFQGAFLSVLLLIATIPIAVMAERAHRNRFKQRDEIDRCDSILEKFAQSLSALDPIGTGDSHYDVINESYVKDKAITLAVRVVEAQTKFDALRNNPVASRDEVTGAGEWIKKCEAQLDKFESNLNNDFGQHLDRPSIFRAAEAHLVKTRLKK